jgi:hypothetical protein
MASVEAKLEPPLGARIVAVGGVLEVSFFLWPGGIRRREEEVNVGVVAAVSVVWMGSLTTRK